MAGFFEKKQNPAETLLTELAKIEEQVHKAAESFNNSGMKLAAEQLSQLEQNISKLLLQSKNLKDEDLQQAANTEDNALKNEAATPKP